MDKSIDRWLRRDGLALIAGWRRWGADESEVAKRMGIPWATLRNWAKTNEPIANALATCKEAADFLVEEALFNLALDGDKKALELWLKYRGQGTGAKGQKLQDGADYVELARMINGE